MGAGFFLGFCAVLLFVGLMIRRVNVRNKYVKGAFGFVSVLILGLPVSYVATIIIGLTVDLPLMLITGKNIHEPIYFAIINLVGLFIYIYKVYIKPPEKPKKFNIGGFLYHVLCVNILGDTFLVINLIMEKNMR